MGCNEKIHSAGTVVQEKKETLKKMYWKRGNKNIVSENRTQKEPTVIRKENCTISLKNNSFL